MFEPMEEFWRRIQTHAPPPSAVRPPRDTAGASGADGFNGRWPLLARPVQRWPVAQRSIGVREACMPAGLCVGAPDASKYVGSRPALPDQLARHGRFPSMASTAVDSGGSGLGRRRLPLAR